MVYIKILKLKKYVLPFSYLYNGNAAIIWWKIKLTLMNKKFNKSIFKLILWVKSIMFLSLVIMKVIE